MDISKRVLNREFTHNCKQCGEENTFNMNDFVNSSVKHCTKCGNEFIFQDDDGGAASFAKSLNKLDNTLKKFKK